MENTENTKEDRITLISGELEKIGKHIKKYSLGAYPAFCLQVHTSLKLKEIIDLRLSDICLCEEGKVRLKSKIVIGGKEVELQEEARRELAWYVMQRVQVNGATQECLDETYLCVNRTGNPLNMQVFRKTLERTCDELGLSRIYNPQYLRSLYGYLEIAYGRKTIDDVAREFEVERYYLLARVFHGMEIVYASSLIDEVAGISATRREDEK